MSEAPSESRSPGELDAPPEPRGDRDIIGAGIAAFVLSRIWIAFFFQPQISDVVLYYNTAVRVIDLRQGVYDRVPVPDAPPGAPHMQPPLGYPPVAAWLMLLPRTVDPQPVIPGNPQATYPRYYQTFRLQMLVLDAIAFCLFAGTISRRRRPALPAAIWAWTLVSATLAYTLYDRTDVAVWFCVTLWAYAWSRRAGDGSFDAWSALAAAAIGLGIAVKLVTAVMAPFVLLGVWQSRRRAADLFAATLVLAAAAGLPFAIFLPAAGLDVFYFLERHGGRSIQIESVYATVMMLLRPFDPDMKPIYEVSAWHLDSKFTPAFRMLAAVCLYGGAVVAMVWAWRARARFDDRRTYCAAGLALAALLCVAHVLSPQYFIWGLGILLLVGTEMNPRAYLRLAAAALLVAGLTTYVFPFHLDAWYFFNGKMLPQPVNLVRDFHWLPRAALIARNALFVGLVIWTALRLLRPALSAPRARGL